MSERVRLAVVLDLENLLHDFRRSGALELGLRQISTAVATYAARGTLISGIAYCDEALARRAAWPLSAVGVRVHVRSSSGPDAADRDLLSHLEFGLPGSANQVVIGSGDHIFSEAAARLRSTGRRVEILANVGKLSSELYRTADSVQMLPASLAA